MIMIMMMMLIFGGYIDHMMIYRSHDDDNVVYIFGGYIVCKRSDALIEGSTFVNINDLTTTTRIAL